MQAVAQAGQVEPGQPTAGNGGGPQVMARSFIQPSTRRSAVLAIVTVAGLSTPKVLGWRPSAVSLRR